MSLKMDDLEREIKLREEQLQQTIKSLSFDSNAQPGRECAKNKDEVHLLDVQEDSEVKFRKVNHNGLKQTSGYVSEENSRTMTHMVADIDNYRDEDNVGTITSGSGVRSSAGHIVTSTPQPLEKELKEHRPNAPYCVPLMRSSGRPNITPERFDGKSPLKDYRQHFEACVIANGWSDSQAAVFLAASLKGTALKVLGLCTSNGEQPQYKELIKLLESQFGPGQMAENYLMELRMRRQGQNETLRELGQGIRELVALAYPEFHGSGRDRLARALFASLHWPQRISNEWKPKETVD